ncbi:MAG: LysR family transcriptional regulator [Planctomycetota bacterium]|jgi:DNA-binding transcriptional LysR family regulator|nr:LysR family transcriptional regulator [Planctomycetota bacterium]
MFPGHLPPTEQLIGALTIARLGSFTRAAQELGLSQPALSRQIMNLEKHLGVRVFDRVGRSVRLTSAGEELVARIGPLLEELSRVTVNLAAAGGSAAGRVRLGASESVAVHVLPSILRSYLQNHRRVDLRLICATTERLPEMVASGEVDVAVTSIEYEPPGLQIKQLWDEELVLVLPMGHKARSRSVLSYKSEDFILLSPGTITRRLLDRALVEANVELKVVLEHSSPEVIKAMVFAGLGLAILPEPTVRRETRRGELAAWPLTDLRVIRPIVAITDPRRQPWPAEMALMDALEKYGR